MSGRVLHNCEHEAGGIKAAQKGLPHVLPVPRTETEGAAGDELAPAAQAATLTRRQPSDGTSRAMSAANRGQENNGAGPLEVEVVRCR